MTVPTNGAATLRPAQGDRRLAALRTALHRLRGTDLQARLGRAPPAPASPGVKPHHQGSSPGHGMLVALKAGEQRYRGQLQSGTRRLAPEERLGPEERAEKRIRAAGQAVAELRGGAPVGFPVSASNIDGLESAFGSKTFSITEQIKSLFYYLRAMQTA
ncbi:hypothetical protein AV530_008104 [Patagioenas fasciata monilis]|uniref:Uncharacterized protein n=1 Tax=Patagioenas fasciata monilis TaxID=372326 RepID=A0A1V4KUD8_PATFA|nr:hypothetical protein AV530_008104 [Patagioenas fasciata monilis]